VADIEFAYSFDGGDGANIAIGQAVACVYDESRRMGDVAGVAEGIEGFLDCAVLFCVGVCTGVEFDGVASGPGGGEDVVFVRGDEGADEDAFFVHSAHDLFEAVLLCYTVQAAFGGQFLPLLGDKGDLVGDDLFGDFDNRFGHGHFEVELSSDGLFEDHDVAVIDMTTVHAEMDGYAVCAGEFALDGSPDGVRFVGPTGLSNRGDMVDIYIEKAHFLPQKTVIRKNYSVVRWSFKQIKQVLCCRALSWRGDILIFAVMKLEGKTAIITGSTGGLANAIALALADAGCDCVCHYHNNRDFAEKLVGKIQQKGRKAAAVGADLRRPEEIDGLFREATSLGEVRVLINAAAMFARQGLDEVTFEKAQEVLAVNLTGPIIASREFARIVPASEGGQVAGKIVNIADVGGIRPWAKYTLYCASKAGLISATQSLAKELAPRICVNAVAPGLVTWPEGFSDKAKERQLARIPLARIARAEDITDAVIFLLGNDYVTGQVVSVDGGRGI